ncbi:MAG: DNA-binding response regulator [Betaproteobacteria bacterium RIFCSPLOWO2_12_FULL_65_14]|nr:MAG: DNA-binding response regulator [Betaproteobacteria bacterium RIFCSPLOWO2_12_FULL_65_14]
MRVLIVEDDPMIGRALATGLEESGYAADWVRDGAAAELALSQDTYDLALLDLGLPRKDGLEVLKTLRRAKVQVPVLVISARESLADRITGLDSGADDYLVKPFDLDEVLARMRAVFRRHAGRATPEVAYGALTLDPANRLVRFRGKPVALSTREFALLEALMRQPGALVTREKLLDTVYGWGAEVESNAIEVHLHHLRRKLCPELILNVRGVGYRVVPVD